jgi:hypothetical protein
MARKRQRKQPKRVIIYDPRRIYALAEEFHRAFLVLHKAQYNVPLITPYSVLPSAVTMIAAFSLELYLKCLHVMDHASSPEQTHNLKYLFEALSGTTKRKIEKYFDPTAGQAALDDIRKKLPPNAVIWHLPLKFDLSFAIFASSKAFEYVRYAYERPAYVTEQWCGGPIIDAIRKLIAEQNPTWKYLPPAHGMSINLLPSFPTRSGQKRPSRSS